jgi:radical SAM protein (TIGR01212 family)
MGPSKRYTDFNTYLKNKFGCRVQKVSLDAGLTCPNRDGTLSGGGCIYCNARGSGTGAHARGLSITAQLLAGKAALARRYKAKKFIAYFQSFSNTYGPLSRLKKLYDEALAVAGVVGLSIGTRPDCVDDRVLDLLAGYAARHAVWVELGLQSAHDATLKLINRGHDAACFQEAAIAAKARGLDVCAHVILGLPQETCTHVHATARFLAALPVVGVKLHLLYVVRGTPLERLYRRGAYGCLSQAAYVELVCDFLERLPARVVIQRLTGDPHPSELVAPMWSLRKRDTLAMIHTTLEKRNSWQGKHLGHRWTQAGR